MLSHSRHLRTASGGIRDIYQFLASFIREREKRIQKKKQTDLATQK